MLAHLTAGASLNPVRWLTGVIRCRFDFDKQVALRLAEQLGATPAEALARFRCAVTSTIKPPLPTAAMLGETIVRGEDIRRPLGIHRDYPITTLTRLANYYQGSDLVGLAKGRIVGLRMQASDGPFAANRHQHRGRPGRPERILFVSRGCGARCYLSSAATQKIFIRPSQLLHLLCTRVLSECEVGQIGQLGA